MRSLSLALLLVGCGGPRWSEAVDTDGLGALSGVWGSGPDDVWIVGGAPGRADVLHYDGLTWEPEQVPADDLLVWVFGFGPDEVWSVGQSGNVVRRTPSGWERLDAGTDQDLWGIWGNAPDDLWIVGGAIDSGDPLILHWDGAGFTREPLDPSQNDRGARSLFKVYGHAGAVFAVGQGGLVVERVDGVWTQRSTGAEADEDFVSLWGDADGLTAVGGRSSAQLSRLDGGAWNTWTPPGMPGLNAVTVTAEGTVLVGGTAGFVGRLDGESLLREDPPVGTSHDIHAMWNDGDGTTWAVGGRFYEPYEGTAWRRDP